MFTPGQMIDHFRIERKLGEGGMGEVYLATDTRLDRSVAIKTLIPEQFDQPEQLDRFAREAQTAGKINHPNVMSIFDIGEATDDRGDIKYIVMEYVPGDSLSSHLSEGAIDLAEQLRLGEKIASGLAAAHKLGIVHRDIKPDNILLDDHGEPKILDFGLAKPTVGMQFDGEDGATQSVSAELTKVGKILGTVSYMSPEQVRGEPVDTRSDIFSFGILLYRMVAGELPFSSPTQVSTLAKILESIPEPPSARNVDVPPELERIIDKCLQKDPDDRYQDTRDLVVDLRNLRRQFDSGVSRSISITGPVAVQQPKKKSFWQNLTWKQVVLLIFVTPFAFGLAVVLFGIIAGLVTSWGEDEASTEELEITGDALAILTFANRSQDTTYNWLETGLPEILLTDLAQSTDLRLVSGDRVRGLLRSEGNSRPSPEDLIRASAALGADKVLSGSLYSVGGVLRIDARLQDLRTDRIVVSEDVSGADAFSLVDTLSQRIALSLDSGAVAASGSVSEFAGSPQAYRFYVAGLELFADEDYEAAIEQFELALEVDSTFALPYLRIGMCHLFSGRTTQARPFFARAEELGERLPVRDRKLTEVYADLWLRQEFGDGFRKMEQLVRDRSDDPEIRSVFGILLWGFETDTVRAFAQFDSALAIDPTFQLALQQYAQIYETLDLYDEAERYIERMRRFHPDAPGAYRALLSIYRSQDDFPNAIATALEARRQFADKPWPIRSLYGIAVEVRDFEMAQAYTDTLLSLHGDDFFELARAHRAQATIALWEGRFRDAITARTESLEASLETGDTNLVLQDMQALQGLYYTFEFPDSAIFWAERAYEWSDVFNRLNFPLVMAELQPETATTLRPLMVQNTNDFRNRLPDNLRPMADLLLDIFDANIATDTNRIMSLLDSFIVIQPNTQPTTGNHRLLGQMAVETGDYARGLELLLPFVEGEGRTSSGLQYPLLCYFVGRSYEGVDDITSAIRYYERMLNYWSDPQIEFTRITDARERLARLRS